eukprot:TRINITY_DN34282_c0_g1_i1.p1 TRINITY_DN34282_c0_g1~~TRINITY_DN34282_c0_g1_i1.p1  ORF type:complete len:186 (+),score=27.68 TRINITY_DN34282_c0_g1_i1:88-645(+)
MTIISHDVVVRPLGLHKLRRKEANILSMSKKAAEFTYRKEEARMGIFPKQLFRANLPDTSNRKVSGLPTTPEISCLTVPIRKRNLAREATRAKDYSPFRASQPRYLHLKTTVDQNITASLLENPSCPLYSSFSQSRSFDDSFVFRPTRQARRTPTPNPSVEPTFTVQDIRIRTPEPVRSTKVVDL